MDIYLSVNNRADILKIPVLPSSFTISKPQSTEAFETMSQGELQLIGTPKLKSITISSFFPVRDYSYLRDTSMKGFEYTYKIDTWIQHKLPIRLIITGTPINMAVAIKNFEYTVKTDGDLWYTLELEEFNLLGYEYQEDEEEIDMEELNRLRERVEYLAGVVEQLANPMIYNYVDDNMPEWARARVQKAIDCGILTGEGEGWNLTYDMLRMFVYFDRSGLFDYSPDGTGTLKPQLDNLTERVEQLANPMIYNYIDDNMPEWARTSVQKAVNKGVLSGDDGGFNLTQEGLRIFVYFDRMGLLD